MELLCLGLYKVECGASGFGLGLAWLLVWLGAGLCERLWSFWVLHCIKLIVGLLGLAWGWLM